MWSMYHCLPKQFCDTVTVFLTLQYVFVLSSLFFFTEHVKIHVWLLKQVYLSFSWLLPVLVRV